MAKALKPFKTHLHRFAAGDDVSASHDLVPHSLEVLVERGFVTVNEEDAPPISVRSSVMISHGDDEA